MVLYAFEVVYSEVYVFYTILCSTSRIIPYKYSGVEGEVQVLKNTAILRHLKVSIHCLHVYSRCIVGFFFAVNSYLSNLYNLRSVDWIKQKVKRNVRLSHCNLQSVAWNMQFVYSIIQFFNRQYEK